MIRVLLFGPYPADSDHVDGGVEASFYNLVEGLKGLEDIELHVVTRTRAPSAGAAAADLPVTYLGNQARFNNLTLHRQDRQRFRDACARIRPDVVHAQDALGYGYVALRAAQAVPVCVSIHGIVKEEVKYQRSRRDRLRSTLFLVPLQRYCVEHAQDLLQPSRYPEAYFGAKIRGRITDVGNPISEIFFGNNDDTRQPGRVLYAGGVTPGKRVLDLVEALKTVRESVPDAHLRVVGHLSNAEYVAELRQRVDQLGLIGSVALLGALSPAALAAEYAGASLFVLPSGQENSPMVIGEAMAAGLPVVATRVGGVSSLVTEDVTGFLVDVGAVEQIAQHVVTLLLDEGRNRAFGEAARLDAERRFRPNQVAARVREVYRGALNAAGSLEHA